MFVTITIGNVKVVYSIKNIINIPYNCNLKRSDQVIISRILIGHSQLHVTRTYILKGE